MGTIKLQSYYFTDQKKIIFQDKEFTVTLYRYPSQIEAVEVKNTRGKMVILPYMGQIIWDLAFDGQDLKMKNMFSRPRRAKTIVDTYGCFAFHSGLLSNGCPGPEDTHPLHGEMPCAEMDQAWLEISDDQVTVGGSYEYAKGFGSHYLAAPSVTLAAGKTFIEIAMQVKNLASEAMPLQYMCHMNYAYLPEAAMTQNIPESAFILRETAPAHVKPTEKWLNYTRKLAAEGGTLSVLNHPEMYDPEIVFFADGLDQYQKEAHFEITSPEGVTFFTEFSTEEFNYATRWLLYNADQQVAAFILPGTCRSEGFKAAEKAGTLIHLGAQEEKQFHVITGKK